MLVYGDLARTVSPAAALDTVAGMLGRLSAMRPGIERHAHLVAAFIETGQLAQGIADAEFEARGCDGRSPAQDAAMAVLMEMANVIQRSWRSGFRDEAPLRPGLLDGFSTVSLPDSIMTKRPEGYAFYALYPESYLEAASALGRDPAFRVIGIRSIGTGLAALVASALGAPAPVTVRPIGDPFRREIRLSDEIAAELPSDRTARFALVDEGPGLSGSSFGAVADWLESRGVAPEKIHFFPSHDNDLGPMAGALHRERWRRADRHVVDFDALVVRAKSPAHRLEAWVTDLIGLPEGPLEDVSGGAWRRQRFASETEWPPCHVQQERRKFLLRAGGHTWLLKFVGLGREGAGTFALAQKLHAAGFAPEPVGYRHGFLVERWMEDAGPLPHARLDRAALAERLGSYIGFRARALPAEPGQGASPAELLRMARHNADRGLGDDTAKPLDCLRSSLPRAEAQTRRIRTDNRLHAWEWLQTPAGRLIKTDAVEHHAAHDLVGCQDALWDIAGAKVEFELTPDELDDLCKVFEQASGSPVARDLIAFYEVCYAAFQLGHWTLAGESLAGFPAEAIRTGAAAKRYAQKLRQALDQA